MNYYEHHLGDYAEATAHLSFVEDAAYSRLIRKYYSSEMPLPAEIKSVQRLVGARTKDERGAVETVLKEFFELREDGWHNKRCDEEISRARARIEAARSNGKKGGRPPGGNNPVGYETVTQKEPSPSIPLTQVKALHTPDSILHIPSKNKDRAHALDEARAVQGLDVESFDRWVQYRAERKPAIKTTSMKAAAEELVRFGSATQQAEVVSYSIANGYQGLFARKVNGSHGPPADKPHVTKFERIQEGLKEGNSVTEF